MGAGILSPAGIRGVAAGVRCDESQPCRVRTQGPPGRGRSAHAVARRRSWLERCRSRRRARRAASAPGPDPVRRSPRRPSAPRASRGRIRQGPRLDGLGARSDQAGSAALRPSRRVGELAASRDLRPGGLSWGEHVRARSGVGRTGESWCPGRAGRALQRVEGTTTYARFPQRPRVRVAFFRPAAGDPQPGEEAPVLATRLLDEIRDRVAPMPAGRRALVGGPPRVQKRRATGSRASRS